MKWIPRSYQAQSSDLLYKNKRYGLWIPPGGGKTTILLDVINKIKKKTLLIAPIKVMQTVWPSEIEKWDNFQNIKFTILHGKDKEKNFLKNNVGIYLINPEGLLWLEEVIIKYKRLPWEVLVIDESARFKSAKAKRFKVMKRMIDNFEYRYLLAGNPIPNNYMDLWSQYFILDQGARLGKSITAYRNKYFYQKDRNGFIWLPHSGSKEIIKESVKDISIHVNLDEHIDLPEMIINDIRFELPLKVRKQYNEMEKKLFTIIDDKKVLAQTKVVSTFKLQQICQGFLFESLNEAQKLSGNKPKLYDIHNEKIEYLLELVEELEGEPLFVGYHYKEDARRLEKAFPDAIFFRGKGEELIQIQNEWNAGKIPLLFAQMSTAAHGINLQGYGYNVCFYCLTYNFDIADQFVKRVLRSGQKSKKVIVHRITAKNTIEDVILKAIKSKSSTTENFLKALELYRKGKK